MHYLSDDQTYQQVESVEHQGLVIVFGRGLDDTESQIIDYAVLDLEDYDETKQLDEERWTEVDRLTFPEEYRSLGMSLLTISSSESLEVANTPIQILSDGVHIYLFRQSNNQTLLVNRFILNRITRKLDPVWETRYRRSEQRDISPNSRDTRDHQNMDEEKFYEPTLELTMIKQLGATAGWFTVALTPSAQAGKEIWHIFAYNNQNQVMDYYYFLKDENGLFDFRAKSFNSEGQILPDQSFQLKLTAFDYTLTYLNSPTSQLYIKQEVLSPGQSDERVKRSFRLMLAFPVSYYGSGRVAVVDFAITTQGQLPQFPQTIPLTIVESPDSGMSQPLPIISTDENGLTIVGGLLDFIPSEEAVSLLDGADGNIHLYFKSALEKQDQNNYLVAQYNTDAARANFSASTTSQTQLLFVARQLGEDMNRAEIEILASSNSELCQIKMSYTPTGGDLLEENWQGVPRNLANLIQIISGLADDDIYNPDIQKNKQTFFNYQNRWQIFSSPTTETGHLYWVSLFAGDLLGDDSMPLQITGGSSDEYCNVQIQIELAGITIEETWNDVPRDIQHFQSIMNGTGRDYDDGKTVISHPIYKMPVGSGHLWFIARSANPQNAELIIECMGVNSCSLSLTVWDQVGNKTVEIWEKMPRSVDEFMDILQGESSSYDYSNAHSTDSTAHLEDGSALFALQAVYPSGQIRDQYLSYAPTLAGGSMLFTIIQYGAKGQLDLTVDSIRQQVTATNSQVVMRKTSGLFSVFPDRKVNDLGDIDIQICDGSLSRVQNGIDSAWIWDEPGYALEYTGSCIEFPVGQLDLVNRLTLEAWINPNEQMGLFSNLIYYVSNQARYCLSLKKMVDTNKYQLIAGAGQNAVIADNVIEVDRWSHLAASFYSYNALEFDGRTYLYCGNDPTLNPGENMTLEAWVKIANQSEQEKIIFSKYGDSFTEQSYRLQVVGDKLQFTLRSIEPEYSDYPPIEIETDFINSPSWQYIAVTVATESEMEVISGEVPVIYYNTTFRVTIYINGEQKEQFCQTVANSQKLTLKSSTIPLTIGGIPTDTILAENLLDAPFQIAQIRLWNRELADVEVEENYNYRTLSSNQDELISVWQLGEGEGKIAKDSASENDGTLSYSKMWRPTTLGGQWSIYINGVRSEHKIMDNFTGYGLENVFEMGSIGLDGRMDEVRIWEETLTEEAVRDSMYARLTGAERELRGYWNFNTGSGEKVVDRTGFGNDGSFKVVGQELFQLEFTVEDDQSVQEEVVELQLLFSGDFTIQEVHFDYSNNCFQLDVQTSSAGLTIQENQDFGVQVTQIDDSGQEEASILHNGDSLELLSAIDLTVQIRFENKEIKDGVQISHKVLTPPEWVDQPAPVNNEGPWMRNALGGLAGQLNVNIDRKPTAAEYGDLQMQSDGEIVGVMKRFYAFLDENQRIVLVTDFLVGDLELKYVGQMQSAPSLVGYIEGAPPLPSENLTVNDPKTDDYVDNSWVELFEEDSLFYRYNTTRESKHGYAVDFKAGLYSKFGLSLFNTEEEQKFGAHLVIDRFKGQIDEKSLGAGSISTVSKKVSFCGSWEEKQDYDYTGNPRFLNEEVGQRYLANNMGYALVKSTTVDTYALRVKGSGSLVAYRMTPSPDSKEDWNIIMFPLNPTYVKNGTLDGMVGLVADPDYPNASHGLQGSYYNPQEAYALKDQIQQEKDRIKTYFDQENAITRGQNKNTSLPTGDLLRDWADKISERSLVNTYVWTAQGGLYAEEEQFVDIKSESTGGLRSFLWKAGAYLDFKLVIAGIGLFTELDALYQSQLITTAVSGEEASNTIGLKIGVTGEGWLNKWDRKEEKYLPIDCPGKVETYRFMSFYLAPSTENYATFFQQVVDSNWLLQSMSPNARALRQVTEEKSVWRVLHRTTFIGRVPPAYDSNPLETEAESVRRPINIADNLWFITLVDQELSSTMPNAQEIGNAVDRVLDHDLNELSPRWETFWNQAQDPENPEADELENLRFLSKLYLRNYYETR